MASFAYFEDDPISRQIMQMILTRLLNYREQDVTIWADSEDYLDRLKNLPYKPDVVFLDIHMKPSGGFVMLKGIRDSNLLPGARIVAVTASVMHEEVEQLRQAGFDGVVGKPIDSRIFPELLDRILRGEKVWRPT